MAREYQVLDAEAIRAKLCDLPDWRHMAGALMSVYVFRTPGEAIEFIAVVGAAAEAADHHPTLNWAYDMVSLHLSTDAEEGRVTDADLALAERISAEASGVGGVAVPLDGDELDDVMLP